MRETDIPCCQLIALSKPYLGSICAHGRIVWMVKGVGRRDDKPFQPLRHKYCHLTCNTLHNEVRQHLTTTKWRVLNKQRFERWEDWFRSTQKKFDSFCSVPQQSRIENVTRGCTALETNKQQWWPQYLQQHRQTPKKTDGARTIPIQLKSVNYGHFPSKGMRIISFWNHPQ